MKLNNISNTPIKMQKLSSDMWQTDEEIVIIYDTDEGSIKWTISEGFETNFRSGGTLISPIVPKIGSYAVSYLSHDCGYGDKTLSKALCDTLFYLSLRYYGMGFVRAKGAYYAVKWFGGKAYDGAQTDKISVQWLDK